MHHATFNIKKSHQKLKFPFRLGIVDLGTNSVRFDIYDVCEKLESTRVSRDKWMIRLGDGLFENHRLDDQSLARALKAFNDIAKIIKKSDVKHVIAFGTSALRDSKDRERLIDKVLSETGIEIQVLSGQEEARLIGKGIINNQDTPDGICSLIDIGGGSTEINICHKNTIIDNCSLNLGANRLQQLFLKSSPPKATKSNSDPIGKLRQYIEDIVSQTASSHNWSKTEIAVGSSGTIRAFRRIFESCGQAVEPYEVKTLSSFVMQMSKMNLGELLQVPGMEPKRVDIILAGGILLEEICNIMGIKKIYTSKFALRDGILDEVIEELFFL